MNVPGLGKTWYANDHHTVTLTIRDDNGALVDATGGTATFQVFKQGELVISKGASDDVTVEGSTITVPLLPEDTFGFGGSSYEVLECECEMTSASNEVMTVSRGLFIITADLIA